MEALDVEERETMLAYWKEHAGKSGSSMENMMLDRNASKLDLMDRPEVLSLLPSFRDARVLELASGIGRFTGVFAQSASHVVTVEFVPEFLEKNREENRHYGNVDFRCEDVLRLTLPASSFELVFSCWLQMYLSDEEVRALALRSLEWACPGGYVFFRESCFRQSGDAARSFNPSHYRHPSFYTQLFSTITTATADGACYGLELVMIRNLRTYVEVKGNKGQICWLFKKVPRHTTTTTAAAALLPRVKVGAAGRPAASSSSGFAEAFCARSSPVFAGAEVSRALWSEVMRAEEEEGRQQSGGGARHVLEVGAGPAAALALATTTTSQEGEGAAAIKVWTLERSAEAAEATIERAMKAPPAAGAASSSCFVVVEGRPSLLQDKTYQAGTFDAVRMWETLDADTTSSSTAGDDHDADGGAWSSCVSSAAAALMVVSRAASWLKPKGTLLITTFQHQREAPPTPAAAAATASSSSGVVGEGGGVSEVARAMSKGLGGGEVTVLNMTNMFIEVCERALQRPPRRQQEEGGGGGGQPQDGAGGAERRGDQEALPHEDGEEAWSWSVVWSRRLAEAKAGSLSFLVLLGRAAPASSDNNNSTTINQQVQKGAAATASGEGEDVVVLLNGGHHGDDDDGQEEQQPQGGSEGSINGAGSGGTPGTPVGSSSSSSDDSSEGPEDYEEEERRAV